MPMPPLGVLSVPCPVCRAREGRPCPNRRGYLLDAGSHRERRAAWLAAERAEVREQQETPAGKVAGVSAAV